MAVYNSLAQKVHHKLWVKMENLLHLHHLQDLAYLFLQMQSLLHLPLSDNQVVLVSTLLILLYLWS